MKKRWIVFSLVVIASFAILGWIGTRIYQEMPPIPYQVVSTDGEVIVSNGQIGRGQNVWQTMGGMEVGSIWGHGSYVAPDWTADWLHRETTFVLGEWAQPEFGRDLEQLSAENQAKLRGRLEEMYRTNNFEASTGTLRIEDVRARAFEACLIHYAEVLMEGNTAYAIPASTISDSGRMRDMASFIFWTSWAASTVRPGDDITYTHN